MKVRRCTSCGARLTTRRFLMCWLCRFKEARKKHAQRARMLTVGNVPATETEIVDGPLQGCVNP